MFLKNNNFFISLNDPFLSFIVHFFLNDTLFHDKISFDLKDLVFLKYAAYLFRYLMLACSLVLFIESGFSAPRKYLIKTGILSVICNTSWRAWHYPWKKKIEKKILKFFWNFFLAYNTTHSQTFQPFRKSQMNPKEAFHN